MRNFLVSNLVSSGLSRAEVEEVVATAVASLVDSAPSTLDTLSELATALNDNPNFSSSVLLKSGGTMSGNIAMGNQAITGASSVSTTALTLNGTALGSAVDINAAATAVSGVSGGAVTGSKCLIADSSARIMSGLSVLKSAQLMATADLRLSSATPDIVISSGQTLTVKSSTAINGPIESLTDLAAISAAGLTLGGSTVTPTELGRLSGVTAGSAVASKALVLDAGGAIQSITSLASNSVSTSAVSGSTGLSLGTSTGSVTVTAPLVAQGCGVSVAGTLDATIDSASNINVTPAHRLVRITAGALSLVRITPSTAVTGQIITVYNARTDRAITVGHMGASTNAIFCWWTLLQPGSSMEVFYDGLSGHWRVPNAVPDLLMIRTLPLRNDDDLRCYINTHLGAHVGLNFNAAGYSGGTVNGVSLSLVTAASTSGTNWARTSVAGTMTDYTLADTNHNSGEMQKLTGQVSVFDNATYRIDGLVNGRLYTLLVPSMNVNSSIITNRVEHVERKVGFEFTQGQFMSTEGGTAGVVNSAGTMNMFTFRHGWENGSTSVKFTKNAYINLYAWILIAHAA